MGNKKTCKCCGKQLDIKNFFTSKNKELHPDGYLDVDKNCALMFFDYANPATFMKVLEEADIPWVPHKYLEILYSDFKPMQPNNKALVGKYISKMKLSQYNKYKYSDSVMLQEEAGYTKEEISDPFKFDYPDWGMPPNFFMPLSIDIDRMPQGSVDPDSSKPAFAAIENGGIIAGVDTSILTEEDVRYLSDHWGATASLEDCIKCERAYQQMVNNEYEVKTTTHKDYIKKLCILSIKADKALEVGDFDGYSKLMKVYDQITKAADLQPKSSTSESGEQYMDIGTIARICEEDDFIPNWDIEINQDKLDLTIVDFKLFLKRLVDNDPSIKEMMSEVEKKIKAKDAEELELLDEEEERKEWERYKEEVENLDGYE